eukprot:3063263-Pyramimonas_sp.AAC.1
MFKYYELIDLERLQDRCLRLGFPAAMAKLAVRAYRAPRFLSLGGCLDGPWYAFSGIIAGCSLATTLIRVNSVESLDLVRLRQGAQLALYIDDSGLSAVGTFSFVVDAITEGAPQLHDAIVDGIGAQVAADKSSLICSSAKLGRAIQAKLGVELTGPITS